MCAARNPPEQQELAIFSVSDRTGLAPFAQVLQNCSLQLVASGGTALALRSSRVICTDLADVTGCGEMLGGRVKTLHPVIHAGILARDTDDDMQELADQGIAKVRVVVCNLYPFSETVRDPNHVQSDAIEMVDIGGVTLLRAAAKNHERVTVVCDPADYDRVGEEFLEFGDTTLATRKDLATKVFKLTAAYDADVSDYFRTAIGAPTRMRIRYGINPHQGRAQVYNEFGALPFKVLNGSPSYINIMDALNAWQLVRELFRATGFVAAASFKHVSPAGCAIGLPLTDEDGRAFMLTDLLELMTPLACAYARARGCDRMSSFGDMIALSEICDQITARLVGREVSDGIIAPGYTPQALEILQKKKGGRYLILEMDINYAPRELERRSVFGLTLEQQRNNTIVSPEMFRNLLTGNKTLPYEAVRDLLIATIAVKYTQSNSVVYAKDGQTIGIGAGQQSRIHCTRLAGDKADHWWMRRQPGINQLRFDGTMNRAALTNLIDGIVMGNLPQLSTDEDIPGIDYNYRVMIPNDAERATWARKLSGVALASDAFFPFADNIERASASGAVFLALPMGSTNDDTVIRAADEHNMVVAHLNERLFHH